MKQLLILSGKGGTGKTTIASSFIQLSQARAYADCVVEAPNLHLINNLGEKTSKPYYGMKKAKIDQSKCIKCGLCQTHCRFDAIDFDGTYKINPYMCEGCSVCQFVCPVDAIEMYDSIDGETTIYRGKQLFSTAELNIGSGNSGKLVTEVKENLKSNLTDEEFVIIDGSPGIGCPVIASLSGVDMVLIVAEPTLSGLSDLQRIIETAKHFRVKIAVCVNKYNINESLTLKIKNYVEELKIAFVGKIPYDKNVVKLINKGKTPIDEESEVSFAIKQVYEDTITILNA